MEVCEEAPTPAFHSTRRSIFDEHPRLTLAGIVVVCFLFIIVAAEIALRFLVDYRIDYYTYVTTSNSTHKYPYGEMHINFHLFRGELERLQDGDNALNARQ